MTNLPFIITGNCTNSFFPKAVLNMICLATVTTLLKKIILNAGYACLTFKMSKMITVLAATL